MTLSDQSEPMMDGFVNLPPSPDSVLQWSLGVAWLSYRSKEGEKISVNSLNFVDKLLFLVLRIYLFYAETMLGFPYPHPLPLRWLWWSESITRKKFGYIYRLLR